MAAGRIIRRMNQEGTSRPVRTGPGADRGEPARAAETLSGAGRVWVCIGVLLAATVGLYWNSLDCPFIFDDDDSIVRNVYIRTLWPLTEALKAPRQTTVDGRPVVSLSLAVNYALGGLDVRVYHATNMLIHALAGITLFGVMRRAFLSPRLRERYGRAATGLALATAMVWVSHPLCTQAVTYVIQRAESLMALFYLATVYFALHGMDARRPGGWYVLAVASCALAMGTKEVAISAPVVVLLADRALFAGRFGAALRGRSALYAGLAATMLIQGLLTVSTPRPDMEGFGLGRQTAVNYLLTEFGVVMRYLRLSLWPTGLCLDYGWPLVQSFGEAVFPGLVVLALLGATVHAVVRGKPWGVAAAAFWMILAPTSSVLPLFDPIFEHRMYLPLAALCVLGAALVHSLIVRDVVTGSDAEARRLRAAAVLVLAVVAVFGGLTIRRNRDYRSELAIWTDVVAKRPDNVRGQVNLGTTLTKLGRFDEAYEILQKAVAARPNYAEGRNNLGAVLTKLGRLEEAVAEFQACLAVSDKYPSAHFNLGLVYEELGRTQEAMEQFAHAIRLYPEYPDAHESLAYLLSSQGRRDEAIAHYRSALRYAPMRAKSCNNLGKLLGQKGAYEEAVGWFRAALAASPELMEARNNLAITLGMMGRLDEAIAEFRRALAEHPGHASLHMNLAFALEKAGRRAQAVQEYRAALAIDPDLAAAKGGLERLGAAAAQGGSPDGAAPTSRSAD
ncbi:MAG: hypothetical protein DCC63_14685 [Nitrospira sp.]|nr:MAG: hypothetical protein DCC63_14685 [Nitrospira sp.]